MDQFTTKITSKGQLLWIDAANLKNSFNNSDNNTNNNGATKGGILLDFMSRKNATIFDYVHNNDMNHLSNHIAAG